MIRFLLPVIQVLSVVLISLLQPSNVNIQMNVPEQVVAGNEIEVQITVQKENLEGFSRFLQMIPAGLTAESENSANADFSFKDKRVRLIWLKLPDDNTFTFSYKVKVDERLKGQFSIGGQFSYISDNERKSANIPPKSITIIPSPTIDPALIVDINEFEEKVIQYIPPATAGAENIACIRQDPFKNSNNDEYIVNVLVNKENKDKFAKIEEIIPEGYTAVDITRQGAIFTFKNQTAKFLWMNLPEESNFIVSYRLIPDNPAIMKQPKINGKFSFLEGENTISVDIYQNPANLESLSQQEIYALIQHIKSTPQQPTELVASVDNVPITNIEKEPEKIVEESVKPTKTEKVVTKEPAKPKAEAINKPTVKKSGKTSKYMLEPENGVYYRVQIAAGHKPVNIKWYFKKLNFRDEIRREEHEGWYKYSVGSFKIYKEARDYRVQIWNTTEIDDAFVSAYNNGMRITVQEALMIANQQWYK